MRIRSEAVRIYFWGAREPLIPVISFFGGERASQAMILFLGARELPIHVILFLGGESAAHSLNFILGSKRREPFGCPSRDWSQ